MASAAPAAAGLFLAAGSAGDDRSPSLCASRSPAAAETDATRPLHPPPPPPKVRDKLPLSLRLDQTAKLLTAVGQGMLWLGQLRQASSWNDKLLPGGTALLAWTALAVTVLCPRFYLRHRAWLAPILRLMVLLGPSARSVGMGSALVLEQAGKPGWLGLAGGIARILIGTRVLLLLVGGMVVVLPPASALLTQTALTLLTFNARGYCGTALLTGGIWAGRMRQLAVALEVATLPLLGMLPVPGQGLPSGRILSGEAPPEALCQGVQSFFHIAIGCLLPFLLSLWAWHPPAAPTAAGPWASGSHPQQQHQRQHQHQPQQQQHRQQAKGWLRLLQRRAAGGMAAADLRLHAALCTPRPWVAWFLGVLTWLACKRSVGLG